ncbi:hypothetical protein NBO_16g0046 [Nosema bombycis CQ1]|uniref:Uncharacterized protein n=1 Tax=Nosema bombycis (strain CQ1 / CVCC 102059) TaxID=578461 RepID=R0MKJ1_NOSB1|nr:hypothetical protein NBO_16g0046 [Nosema bombycis CQ1]|eukprot:EOB14760.1 hypothetical protein NBO_16g0046 [Nosema bombycis CQ1]
MDKTEEIKIQEEKVKNLRASFDTKLDNIKKCLDKLKGALDKLTMYANELKENN